MKEDSKKDLMANDDDDEEGPMCSDEGCGQRQGPNVPAPTNATTTTTTPLIHQPNPPSWLTLLVLGPVLFGVADGCIRRSLFSHPEPTTPYPMERTTTPGSSHRQTCRDDEVQYVGCLNGGTCFATVLNDNREAHCNCPPEFTGLRCEEVYIDPSIYQLQDQNMRTANIAAGVSLSVLVVFILLLAAYVYLRMRNRAKAGCSGAGGGGGSTYGTETETNGLAPNGKNSAATSKPAADSDVNISVDHQGALGGAEAGGGRAAADVHLDVQADVIRPMEEGGASGRHPQESAL